MRKQSKTECFAYWEAIVFVWPDWPLSLGTKRLGMRVCATIWAWFFIVKSQSFFESLKHTLFSSYPWRIRRIRWSFLSLGPLNVDFFYTYCYLLKESLVSPLLFFFSLSQEFGVGLAGLMNPWKNFPLPFLSFVQFPCEFFCLEVSFSKRTIKTRRIAF